MRGELQTFGNDYLTDKNWTRKKINCGLKAGNSFVLEYFVFAFAIQISKLKHKLLRFFPLFHGCENWSVAQRKKHRLRVLKIRVLRKLFGSTKDELTGEWRELHTDELHDLYSSPNTDWEMI